MPNIIEQQDLLKGLPDTRLAMLLQNPVGDIPPFLVAAEAQRRQAIRQQFAGSENKESVVDSLTKQLANVPQNIPAPTRTPPMVPPTPEMQGVAALQAQQAVQQMAQPQEAQMMRGGGMVQRYQSQGLVEPSLDSLYGPTNFQDIVRGVKTFGGRAVDRLLDPLGVYDYANYFFPDYISTPSEKISESTGVALDPISIEKERQAQTAGQIGELYDMNARDKEAALRRMAAPPVLTPEELARQREEQARLKRQYQEYAASQQQKKPEETEDEYRARLEALFAVQEPSDWEKAQRYFAMAEQFLDPSKTTMQSIAGAGQAFAQSSAEQARAQREAELAREKALLEYDMGKVERLREAEAAEAKDRREFEQRMKERGTPSADAAISAITRSMIEIEDQIQKLGETPMPNMPIPPENKAEIDRLLRIKEGLNKQMITIMDRGGFINKKIITEADLAALGIT